MNWQVGSSSGLSLSSKFYNVFAQTRTWSKVIQVYIQIFDLEVFSLAGTCKMMFALGWVLVTSYYCSKSDKGSNSSTKPQKEGFLVLIDPKLISILNGGY